MKKLLLTSLILASTQAVASPFVVQNIRIDGASPNTEKHILATLPLHVGQKATENDISDIVRALFIQGDFENVQAKREGNTLVIQVMERPVIASLSVEGSKAIPKDALLESLSSNGIKKGEILQQDKLKAFSQELQNHYQSIGRYNASIDSVVVKLPNNRADVKLIVNEGTPTVIKQLDFIGNHHFTESDLRGEIRQQPKKGWWQIFSDTNINQQKLMTDLETLRTFYNNKGFAKFQIKDMNINLSQDKKEAYVTITLDEGLPYRLSHIRIIGETDGYEKELQPLLNQVKLGELYRGDDIKAIEKGIKLELGNKGFAEATVDVAPEFNDKEQTVEITYVVKTNRRYYVRQIKFEGNDISADSTLRQEMRQQEGAWYSAYLVDLGKQRLDRTGFYESVTVQNKAVAGTSDMLDVIYKVKERNTGSINLGIGFSTDGGLSYQASIKQDNFLGMGSSISLAGSRNDYGTSANLSYNEPYFTKDGVSLGGSLFFEKYNNRKNSNSASYARTTYGANGSLGFPVNENNAYYIGLGYTHDSLKNVLPEYHRSLYLDSMKVNKWSFTSDDFELNAGWNYNSLNRGFFPTKGLRTSLGGKITLPGSDNKYYKIHLDTVGFYPLNQDHSWVLSAQASLNFADGLNGKRLPFYQNYSAGGIGSLRGFSYGAIGPFALYETRDQQGKTQRATFPTKKDDYLGDYYYYDVVGGNAMATTSIELIMPTPFIDAKNQISVRTSMFIDVGSVWDTHWSKKENQYFREKIKGIPDFSDPSRIRASAGIAFQWQSPIGPLVFSYAKPIKKYPGDDVQQFQFSIGGTF